MSKSPRTSGQAEDEQPSTLALTFEWHIAIVMSRTIFVERDIKLADFYDVTIEGRTLSKARYIEEPSMELTVRNVPIVFSPVELARFLGYDRDLVAFPNLPMTTKGRPTKTKLAERMQSVLRPIHEMVSDISGQLTTLEHKVLDMDSGLKMEVVVAQEAMKRVATSVKLFALNQRVVLIEEHFRHIRDVLKITDDDDDE
ncbi:hypothetical protein CJ030_MR2G026825 [Morella rubra]|uniref:Uncharacterized protein n=1 Tax=Morella rubra TaxID=262757 RepID=A0A6A1WC23_9ROSI|nr:hypothetical protein CJ030_MR2G026825 [Morella rubra]